MYTPRNKNYIHTTAIEMIRAPCNHGVRTQTSHFSRRAHIGIPGSSNKTQKLIVNPNFGSVRSRVKISTWEAGLDWTRRPETTSAIWLNIFDRFQTCIASYKPNLAKRIKSLCRASGTTRPSWPEIQIHLNMWAKKPIVHEHFPTPTAIRLSIPIVFSCRFAISEYLLPLCN